MISTAVQGCRTCLSPAWQGKRHERQQTVGIMNSPKRGGKRFLDLKAPKPATFLEQQGALTVVIVAYRTTPWEPGNVRRSTAPSTAPGSRLCQVEIGRTFMDP